MHVGISTDLREDLGENERANARSGDTIDRAGAGSQAGRLLVCRPMRIQVLFFAAARERVGLNAAHFDLDPGATLGALREALLAAHPPLEALQRHVRWARNEHFTRDFDTPLAEGDVVALIPPVSGGAPRVLLTHDPLDARAVEALVAGPDRGGLVTFTGTVRDHTGPHGVVRLEYEAYASMATRVLEQIAHEVVERWPAARVAIHHRLGALEIGEAAVVIAVSTAHRAAAFEACAYTIERLKADVPIFKKEIRTDGSEWVGLGP
jgi:molybdopterin converting factor subunit 1